MNRKQILANYKRVNEEIQAAKRVIAKDIANFLKEKKITQLEAAFLTNDAASQISLICTGKLRGFSTERLIRIRAMLGAEIRVLTNPNVSKPRIATGSWK